MKSKEADILKRKDTREKVKYDQKCSLHRTMASWQLKLLTEWYPIWGL